VAGPTAIFYSILGFSLPANNVFIVEFYKPNTLKVHPSIFGITSYESQFEVFPSFDRNEKWFPHCGYEPTTSCWRLLLPLHVGHVYSFYFKLLLNFKEYTETKGLEQSIKLIQNLLPLNLFFCCYLKSKFHNIL
jgi:hypothetical protein